MKRKLLNKGDLILNGKYEIVKLIHNKGMSNVYLVMNRRLNDQMQRVNIEVRKITVRLFKSMIL